MPENSEDFVEVFETDDDVEAPPLGFRREVKNMAPINGKTSGPTSIEVKQEEDEEAQSIWSSILSQVQASSLNKLPSCKVILVLGDNESGKTSLIAKLQGNEDPKKGSGLEYHVIAVKDDYRDDVSRLGVWVMDGDPWHKNLLKFVLNEDSITHTTVLLATSMTQPWDIMECLQNWATILEEHIGRLKIPPDQMEQYAQQMMKRYQGYVEPGDEPDAVTRKTSPASEDPSVFFPLGEDTLIHNLGLDVIVIITKTDYMSTLEKEYDYKEEHFDFIQQAVRKFCLKYGASLFYTSVKEDKNCDLLYKYIVHRIYGFGFKTPALVVEKDAVFIPAGWDNEKKIAILYENLTAVTPDDSYSDVIVKPLTRKPLQREAEVSAENDQMFLIRQQALLSQQQLTPVRQESPVRNPPQSVQKSADRRLAGSPGVQATPKKMEGAKPVVGSEGVLQNFFNSLLNRKTGSPPAGITQTPLRGEKTIARSDVTAELDRIAKTKKPATPTIDGGPSSASNEDLSCPPPET